MMACPGRENHAWREAETARCERGVDHDLTPRWGAPIHCGPCAMRAHAQLAELPELVVAVSLEATHGSRGPKVGTIGRIGGAIPSWPGQASRLLTDLIVGGLTELEDDIRDLRGLTARPSRGTEGATLTSAVRFLTAHLDWALIYHPAAGEPHEKGSANPAAQIGGWYRAAQRFTRRDARLEQREARCPRCDWRSLFFADGDDYIGCRNPACGVLLTEAEYADWTAKVLEVHATQKLMLSRG